MKILDKRFDFVETEKIFLKKWKKNNTFKFSNKKTLDSKFSIMMPPPNITGSLHMGHALTFTLQDILIRFNKKLGKQVLWQPGIDHAGIATELIVEKKLIKEDKKTKDQIGRDAFLKKIWLWKNESGNKIVDQLERLGAAVDWNISKFTMDSQLSESVNEVFVKLYEEGLIYKDKRLINWDPQIKSAVSDLEVTQRDVVGNLWFIKYKIADSNSNIIVATTRPETMFGDTAIAIHPKNNKLNSSIGKEAIIPFLNKKIPIIADDYADPEKGSGAVKITPAHDFNDFVIGKKHNLEFVNIFDSSAKLNSNVPKSFVGLDRFNARTKIVKFLQKEKMISKIKKNEMTVPVGERSGSIIEPFLTDQWFLDSEKLCKPIKNAIKKNKIIFYPSSWINTFKHWIDNIEPWCISRQIWWGHRIPVWYTNYGDIIVAKNEKLAKEKLIKGNYPKDVIISRRETDVLDTWFSSALWPFSTLGWPKKNNLLKNYYPSDVLVTGFDIIFFWVARMIMMGFKFMKKMPFKSIYIHPLVRDEKGEKMSKSKGNVIDPIEIINLYGSDALRFTLANLSTQGRDIKLSNKLVENSRNFITKLWNTARFSQFNRFKLNKNYNPYKNKLLINKWLIYKIGLTQRSVLAHLKVYKFNLIISDLYQFIWSEFCDLYIELSKFYLKDKKYFQEISNTFSFSLNQILNLINPVIPFVTEKISNDLGYSRVSLFDTKFSKNIQISKFKINEIKEFEKIIELIKNVRIELSKYTSNKKDFSLIIQSKAKIEWVDHNIELIKSVLKFNEIKYSLDQNKKNVFLSSKIKFSLSFDINLTSKNNFSKKIEFYEKEVSYFKKKLNNKSFIQKAPKKIVDLEKKKLIEAEKNLKLLKHSNV
tara:strand:+ start:801 stop:3422 length:2622 start_codon:yes stop_codon:yes gene_type:complete